LFLFVYRVRGFPAGNNGKLMERVLCIVQFSVIFLSASYVPLRCLVLSFVDGCTYYVFFTAGHLLVDWDGRLHPPFAHHPTPSIRRPSIPSVAHLSLQCRDILTGSPLTFLTVLLSLRFLSLSTGDFPHRTRESLESTNPSVK
jgi:hypothetical protein